MTPPGASDPCAEGQILDSEDPTCTAYVAFSRWLYERRWPRSGCTASKVTASASFASPGLAELPVIVIRRATRGDRTFSGARSRGAVVASVSDAGQAVTGFAPSLSYTGRYLAFVSGFLNSRSDGGRAQVLIHDTDAGGNRSWLSGSTTNVSIADGDRHVDLAVQPSISGDGHRLAFVEPYRQDVCTCPYLGARIHVRDLTQGVSRVVAGPDEPASATFNVSPSLSRDGAAVAFVSDDDTYVPPGGQTEGLPQVYLQDLPVDLTSAFPERVIVSLSRNDTNTGWAGSPALSRDGGVIAFTSSAPLTDQGRRCCGDDARQVFARTRFGSARLSENRLLFAAPVPGFAGDVEYETVSNDGPGPVQFSASVRGPFRISQQCPPSLAANEQCSLGIEHVPPPPDSDTEPAANPAVDGGRAGTLTLQFEGVDEGQGREAVPLVIWRHSLEPASLQFADVLVGTASDARVVKVTNGFDRPLVIRGVLLPPGAVPEPASTSAFAAVDEDDFAVDEGKAEDGNQDQDQADDRDEADDEDNSVSCGIVDPGETCELEVTFAPTHLRDQERWLAIGTPSPYPPYWEAVEYAPVTGLIEEPTLTTSPTVAREGRVVFVTGTGFKPDVPVLLGWSGGPVAVQEIVPDSTGAFSAPVVVISGRPGTHELTVTMPEVGTVTAAPVLVVPGSLQPPDFTGRN